MGYNWSESILDDTVIDSSDFQEVINKTKTIESHVVNSKPYLPVGTPYCASNDPTTGLYWDEPSSGETMDDQEIDIAAENLDYVRENNWCRGHFVDHNISVKTSDETSDHGTQYGTENGTDNRTVHNGHDATEDYDDKGNHHGGDHYSHKGGVNFHG